MTKFDVQEIINYQKALEQCNIETHSQLSSLKTKLLEFILDSNITGEAVNAAKEYYNQSYMGVFRLIEDAMNIAEREISIYLTHFYSQVDDSRDAVIDTDGLAFIEAQILSYKNSLENLQRNITIGMGTYYQNQIFQLENGLVDLYKREDILNKFIAFEQTHVGHFDRLDELIKIISHTFSEMMSHVQFNESTGMYDFATFNYTVLNDLKTAVYHTMFDKEMEKELESCHVYAIPMINPENGEVWFRWVIEKDGVNYPNRDLQIYVREIGKYLPKDKLTYITPELLEDKRIEAGKQGKNYDAGEIYSCALGDIYSMSSHVESADRWAQKTGVKEAVTAIIDAGLTIGSSYLSPNSLYLSYYKPSGKGDIGDIISALTDIDTEGAPVEGSEIDLEALVEALNKGKQNE
ncbi:hypothetical protein HCB25_00295 [Listeria booriae]|uniref:LXG domain-containing protein n=1 Tax=Listeria booriae TaxID=1552123 RepID=A0A842FFA4_9LIST|nr:T7SS effector LXG polymorphic toxin [Listeria booriae]MBC2242481.1 hypothetical protein [Listeria booriae]